MKEEIDEVPATKPDEIERNLAFTMLADEIIDDERVGKHELLVYLAICRFVPGKVRTAFPSLATLATKSRLSKSTVQSAITELTKLGYLSKESRQRDNGSASSNLYHLTEGGMPHHGTPPIPQDTTLLKGDTSSEGDTPKGRGAKDLDTTRSRDEDNEATPDPVPPDFKPPGVLKAMEQVAREAGKPWTIYPDNRTVIESAVAVFGGEVVVDTWREWLTNGGSAKLSIFLEDVKYPKPKPKRAPPATCEYCQTEVPVLTPMDDAMLCDTCARKLSDKELTPEQIAQAKDPQHFAKVAMGVAS